MGGYAHATASGIGVGVISPRITPLRESHIMRAAHEGAPVLKAVSQDFLGQGIDRVGDGALGVANYLVTPQEESLSLDGIKKEAFKGAMGGGSGSSSSGTADAIRPATIIGE